MNSITLWNRGRRTWDLVNISGEKVKLAPQESMEMDEVQGLKKILAYPRDFTSSKISSPSSEDLKRREQSLRDRESAFKIKEDALDAREAKIKEREQEQVKNGQSETGEANNPETEREALLSEAFNLGLIIDGRMGNKKIKTLIEEKKSSVKEE